MPLVRISLIRGKSPDYLRALSDGVHRALIETYNVPHDDRFHLIEQLDPDALVYDDGYVGVHRSPDVVFIHVIAGRWRDVATKKALYRRLAEVLSEHPGLRPEDVQVVVTENEKQDWSFGNGVASYLPEAKDALPEAKDAAPVTREALR